MPEQKTLSVLSVLLIFVYFSFQSMRLWMVFQKYYSGYRKLNIYIQDHKITLKGKGNSCG